MLDEGVQSSWPDDVRKANAPFKQGDLIEKRPFYCMRANGIRLMPGNEDEAAACSTPTSSARTRALGSPLFESNSRFCRASAHVELDGQLRASRSRESVAVRHSLPVSTEISGVSRLQWTKKRGFQEHQTRTVEGESGGGGI